MVAQGWPQNCPPTICPTPTAPPTHLHPWPSHLIWWPHPLVAALSRVRVGGGDAGCGTQPKQLKSFRSPPSCQLCTATFSMVRLIPHCHLTFSSLHSAPWLKFQDVWP